MNNLQTYLKHPPLIYVTRDIERALGLDLDTPGYFIISNFSEFANSIAKGRKNVLLIKNKVMLDTWELLRRFANPDPALAGEGSLSKTPKEAQKRDYSVALLLRNGQLVVFKPTPQIEKICAENNWKLSNPPSELSNEVEEKISQIKWLGPLKKYLPNYKVLKCKNITWPFRPFGHFRSSKPFILQFNRSHTGSGTMLIENEKQLKEIQKKFPEREVRLAEYIPGPLFTNNNIVAKDKNLIGNINYQITGLKPFTDLPFSTIGNDWALPRKILTKKQITQYKKIATAVGLRLKKAGWRGLFGIDVVADEKTGKLYLLEINCRQPASAAYESQLQMSVCHPELVSGSFKAINVVEKMPKQVRHDNQVTTFEAHLMALSDLDLKGYKLIEIKDGAQVIQRITKKINYLPLPKYYKNRKTPFHTIHYRNTALGGDLLRLQTEHGIMKHHNSFNQLGSQLIDFVHCLQKK